MTTFQGELQAAESERDSFAQQVAQLKEVRLDGGLFVKVFETLLTILPCDLGSLHPRE